MAGRAWRWALQLSEDPLTFGRCYIYQCELPVRCVRAVGSTKGSEARSRIKARKGVGECTIRISKSAAASRGKGPSWLRFWILPSKSQSIVQQKQLVAAHL